MAQLAGFESELFQFVTSLTGSTALLGLPRTLLIAKVKNNLQIISSLLDLQAVRIEDVQLQDILQKSQSRISSMAQVHESLYRSQNFAEINLTDYIRSLATDLFDTYKIHPSAISLRVNVKTDIVVSLDKAIPCGLILNELITNALKHGFRDNQAGEVFVSLEASSEGQLTLMVGNTGDSLPAHFDLEKAQSLGLQLVKALVQQLEGTLNLDRRDKTVFKIIFNREQTTDY